MKRLFPGSVLGLLLCTLMLPAVSTAEGDGPSASGTFQISLENGVSREIKFDARLARDGATIGEITFQDVAPPKNAKQGATADDEAAKLPKFHAKATCDCLVVRGIEAVMSGTITEADPESYVGRRVILVVQDGDSITPPLRDKLTYGLYKIAKHDWVASDFERPEDGPAPAWVATDAERTDDTGVLSQKSEAITCESFPLSSHSFLTSRVGKGKILVQR
jgi:hypothetical protein